MAEDASAAYPPLHTLKPVAADVWIVDGPEIRFGPAWLKMPFPTRTTIVRLARDDLFVHSPTPLTPALQAAVVEIGRVRWIIGPNRLHYWWIPHWRAAYPDADVYLAPRIREQAGGRIDFDGLPLVAETGYPWDAEIATLPVAGRYMTEVVFFHRASRTLILTDLIENFEPGKVRSVWARWLVRLAGVAAPNGRMPPDMRLTYPKPVLRRAVERMIAWDPERVIVAHGKWFEANGTAELRRAFGA